MVMDTVVCDSLMDAGNAGLAEVEEGLKNDQLVALLGLAGNTSRLDVTLVLYE